MQDHDKLKSELLSFGEYFKLAGKAFGALFAVLLPILIVIFIPVSVLLSLVPNDYFSLVLTEESINAASEIWRRFQLYILYVMGIRIFFLVFVVSAVTLTLDLWINGKEVSTISTKALFSQTAEKWWKLMATAFLFNLIIYLSFSFIIFLIYMGIIFFFAVNSAAITDKWGISAMRYSMRLIRGKWLRTFCVIAAVIAAEFFVSQFITAGLYILGFSANNIAAVTALTISQIICVYFTILTALVFLNYHLLSI